MKSKKLKSKKIRYAVLGLGHIAQVAVLPAFRNAEKNSQLTTLISSDAKKLKLLSRKYRVQSTYAEEEFSQALASGDFEALYIATPNSTHSQYIEQALEHGIHVLCEKPLTVDLDAAEKIEKTLKKTSAKLMVAYRLHFDPANLKAISLAQSGKLGDLRYFSSTFSFQIKDPQNIRLKGEEGLGPLHDIGIYCINAARYLFKGEPTEVLAISEGSADRRFSEVPEMVAATLRFSDHRLAQFTCSFGAADSSVFSVFGTKGSVTLDRAYEYADDRELILKIGDRTSKRKYVQRDQFAAELLYFSDCVNKGKTPEPSIKEGLADLAVIEALRESLESGKLVSVEKVRKKIWPTLRQTISRPAIRRPETVRVTSPSGD